MPKVSVVIPTYNRVDLLARAMRSVKYQTHEDWEMIIVDDHSMDSTPQMVQSWQLNDARIKYHRFSYNSGSPVAPRNVGVSMAEGDYIAFLDSDDLWFKNKLETQLWYMQYHNTFFTYHDLVVQTLGEGGKVEWWQWDKMSTCHSDRVFLFLLRKNFIATSTVMLKKGIYERYGGMDPFLTINHDWDLWLRIAYELPIHFINELLGQIEIHKGSVITEVHKRRVSSRRIVRKWIEKMEGMYYRKVMAYYYLMEVFDILPERLQRKIRRIWYNQSKYKGEKRPDLPAHKQP